MTDALTSAIAHRHLDAGGDYHPDPAPPELCQRLDRIICGLSMAVDPSGCRTVSGEWVNEGEGPLARLHLSGIYDPAEILVDETASDHQIARAMIDAIYPRARDVLARDQWKKEGKPAFDLVRISNLHRQLLNNAGIDISSYLDRIGGEKYIHHQPNYSGSDYFPIPSLAGDMERLPQGLGDIMLDKNGRLKATLNVQFTDDITLDIGAGYTEFRIAGQLPSTLLATLEGNDLLETIEIDALKGAIAKVIAIDTSNASQMRPEMHYINVEDHHDYAGAPIWDENLEESLTDRLAKWAEKVS